MNIQQFGIAYAERYEDRISKLQKVFTENSKNVLCATLKASYPKLFGRIKALSGATRDNCVSQEFLFNFLFPSERRTCLHCGSSTKFTAEFKRYREFCCSECRNASDIVVQRRNSAVFDKYGVDNIFKAEQFKEHTKKVMQKKYGVTNPSQSELVKERKRETFLSNYGVDHVSKTAKAKQRFSENNPMYDKVSVARMRRTNRIRYGVANPAQNKEVIAKTKKTHEDRYGCNAGALVSYATRFKIKQVTGKFGKLHNIQGYEDRAINYLSSLDFISEIITGAQNIKKIFYTNSKGTQSCYYPDILVTTNKGKKHLIEVKSSLTLFNKLRPGYYENAILKFAEATKYMKKRGGCFWIYYYDDYNNFYRIKNPESDEQIRKALRVKIL